MTQGDDDQAQGKQDMPPTGKQRPIVRTIQVGKGLIDILNTDQQFINGIQAGILAFSLHASHQRQTEERIVQLVRDQLAATEQSEACNVGFLVGWVAELVQGAAV